MSTPLLPGQRGYAGYKAGQVLGECPIDLDDLRLDRVDEYGGMWSVTEFAGRGSAPTSVDVTQRTRAHGAWIGGRYWGAKPYTLSGAYEGASPDDRFDAQQRLLRTLDVERDVLMVVHEETVWQSVVLLNGEVTIDAANAYAFTWQAPLIAADPFRYDVTEHTVQTKLPIATGGRAWPTRWPTTWPGVATQGTITITNTGTAIAWPVVRVYGPLPDFTLSQPETGKRLSVLPPTPLVDGDWVDVDMGRQRVMRQGQTSERSSARGDFFGLPLGQSTFMFTSSVSNPTARAVLTWRATYV